MITTPLEITFQKFLSNRNFLSAEPSAQELKKWDKPASENPSKNHLGWPSRSVWSGKIPSGLPNSISIGSMTPQVGIILGLEFAGTPACIQACVGARARA